MENSYYQKSTLVNRVLVAVVTQLFVVVAEIPISRNESNQNIFQLYYASIRWLWWGNFLSMSNGRGLDNLWIYLQRRSQKISSMNPFWLSKVNFAFYIWLRKITKLFVKKEKQSQLSNYHHGIRHDGSHLTQLAEGGTFWNIHGANF